MGKVCNKCKIYKTDYHRDSSKKDGLCTICSDCKRKNSRYWYSKNIEVSRKASLDYYYANKDDQDFVSKRRQYGFKWRKLNPDLNAQKSSNYRARKLGATPNWLTNSHKEQMQFLYELARDCRLISGQDYHVDHIVPLKGDNICGLHVPWNLQVLPSDVNISKGNKND